MNLSDKEFLTWIRDRIVNVYGESPNTDFVLRLGKIIEKTSSETHKHDYCMQRGDDGGQRWVECVCGARARII